MLSLSRHVPHAHVSTLGGGWDRKKYVGNELYKKKLGVVGLGVRFIHPGNWHPFAPHGWPGIQAGAAIIFFAYIGFDAISTAAEETREPQRNLPRGILGGLAICTAIYVVVGAVMVGMVPYRELAVADPLARALELAGFKAIGSIVALGAVISMSAVLLVFQYGQPRIFFAMARDGLLPKWVAKIDPKTRVPYTTTLFTGVFVAVWSLIGDAAETYDLTNIGTLFAFILVCLGVIVLRHADPNRPRPFRVPAAIGRMPILPLLAIASILWLLAYFDWHIYFAGAIALGLTALTFVARQWTRRAMMD